MVWWALKNGHFGEALDADKLKGEIAAMAKAHKKSKRAERRSRHPLQRKWASFGGGFYGLVALYTWILIEWDDVADFLSGLSAIVFELDPGDLARLTGGQTADVKR